MLHTFEDPGDDVQQALVVHHLKVAKQRSEQLGMGFDCTLQFNW